MASQSYPAHISDLLSQLRVIDSSGEVLLSHKSLLQYDTSLSSAYITLGFDHVSGSFRQVIPPREAISVLRKEYEGPAKTRNKGSTSPISSFPGVSPKFAFRWMSHSPTLGGFSVASDLDDYDEASPSLMWADEPGVFQCQEVPVPFPSPPRPKVTGLVNVSLDPLNSRMHRGLKILSTRVREVVKSEGLITYKQVADRLMDDEELKEASSNQKEEKNIRRRVYDALNVLIAAGMLKKEGKYVSWHSEPQRKSSKRSKAASKLLQEQVQDAQARVIARADVLRDLVRKLTLVQALIIRNQGSVPGNEKLTFPLLITATADVPDNSMTVISAPLGQKLTIKFAGEIRVLGEVDLIPLLGLSPVGEETVPKEVQRLLDTYKDSSPWG